MVPRSENLQYHPLMNLIFIYCYAYKNINFPMSFYFDWIYMYTMCDFNLNIAEVIPDK